MQNYSAKIKIILYLGSGILSFIIGPLVVRGHLGTRIPEFDSLADIFLYAGFVLVGISRGIVGRLFLPGFEPPNEDIIGTVISFIPFVVIMGLVGWIIFIDLRFKIYDLRNLLLTSIFVVYPYVWAGFLRYQFGLKQALAERYAYPSLFFFVILIALIINYLLKNRIIRSQKLFIWGALIIFIFQLYFFHQKAKIWEERPLRTKKYFEELEEKVIRGEKIKDEKLPKFINQNFLTTYDLMPIFKNK